jgi:hypothetical protein
VNLQPAIDAAARWVDTVSAANVLQNEWINTWNVVGCCALGVALLVFVVFIVAAIATMWSCW